MNPQLTDDTLPTISTSELSAVAGGKGKQAVAGGEAQQPVAGGERKKLPFEVPGVPFVMWHGDPGIMSRDEKRSFCAYSSSRYHRECRGIWDEK